MAYNVGKLLRAQATTYNLETCYNTRGNDLGHRNNAWDWTIRGQFTYIRYG